MTITESGDTAGDGTVKIFTGAGGDVQSGVGKGGHGGLMSNLTFTKTGIDGGSDIEIPSIFTGEGGYGRGTGAGGNGGSMVNVTLDIQSPVTGFELFTGSGGPHLGTKSGGTGGSMTNVTFKASAAIATLSDISVGSGGDGGNAESSGGNSGSMKNIELVAPTTGLTINRNARAGDTPTVGKGGKGGDVVGLHGTIGTLAVFAPRGGHANLGTGGAGGSIKNMDITGVLDTVRVIRAGDGGYGNIGGSGGSLSNIKVAGDIGDFDSNFGITALSGMGGLIAGQAGSSGGTVPVDRNGSITTVHAERISAILAGAPLPMSLSVDNAVSKISGITGVTKIGADVDNGNDFDFTDSGSNGFGLDEGDTALDGLVIVKTGGFVNPPVVPLKLLET